MADWAETVGTRLNGVPTQEDQDRLQKWQQDFDEAEKKLLTPDELAEQQLRESDVADWAGNLPGFEPTEDEWRSLTGLRSQYEQAQNDVANAGLTDEERAAHQTELQTNFDSAVQSALTPDQFAQYQLANNDPYQALHNVTQRYGLPDSVATQRPRGAAIRAGGGGPSAGQHHPVTRSPAGRAQRHSTGNRTNPGANPRCASSLHLQGLWRRLDHGLEPDPLS